MITKVGYTRTSKHAISDIINSNSHKNSNDGTLVLQGENLWKLTIKSYEIFLKIDKYPYLFRALTLKYSPKTGFIFSHYCDNSDLFKTDLNSPISQSECACSGSCTGPSTGK